MLDKYHTLKKLRFIKQKLLIDNYLTRNGILDHC